MIRLELSTITVLMPGGLDFPLIYLLSNDISTIEKKREKAT